MNDIEKGQFAKTACDIYRGLSHEIEMFPSYMRRVIEERVWERRHVVDSQGRPRHGSAGGIVELPSLRALITEKPLKGWGQDVDMIRRLLNKLDPEVEVLFREAMKERGGDRKSEDKESTSYIIRHRNHKDAKNRTGTSRAYSIDRVRRECDAETVKAVMSGEISPNKALIRAGIRENRQIYIPRDPRQVLPKLRKAFGDEYAEALISSIKNEN